MAMSQRASKQRNIVLDRTPNGSGCAQAIYWSPGRRHHSAERSAHHRHFRFCSSESDQTAFADSVPDILVAHRFLGKASGRACFILVEYVQQIFT